MLNVDDTLVLGIDLQEKLVNMLSNSDEIKSNSIKLLNAAAILNVKTILTEQYPKGLGFTIDEIKKIKEFKTLEKTSFSAFSTDDIKNNIIKSNRKNIVIFGIETHICVYQTVLELLENGYSIHLVKDCCASRSFDNHSTSLEIMKQKGAAISALEIILFEFLKSSKHPNFKEIQGLIK